ncbi:unnamed protein product [Lactuca virosa]|uniref:Legumain prodomain domain-containing protein n=1 Tax=Lactuca virosa TaxID=75947 RepID=A0AAU9N6Q6_9ASTR|nr:unnamed protein product [Lactuca virosa]
MITVRRLFLCLLVVSGLVVVLLHRYATKVGTDYRSEWNPLRHKDQRISLGEKIDDLVELSYPISQQEAGLMVSWGWYKTSMGQERADALEEIRETLYERAMVDFHVHMIGVLLFGSVKASSILYAPVPPRMMDDSECTISRIEFFHDHCGMVADYGSNISLAITNICHRLVGKEEFEEACIDTCGNKNIIPTGD